MKSVISNWRSVGNFRNCVLLLVIAVGVGAEAVKAADWPTYRGNVARSGSAMESIGSDLHLQWTYVPTHGPVPAWPVPAEEMPRNHSDNAYHVCIAGGRVYFGSSVTNELLCLDVASGDQKWSFYAEGPVRFAPTVYEGKVYFGSDDGYVYCLDAEDGKLVWKFRGGISDEKVLGNGRMISLWPIRTSVLVDGGEVYFAAGVFPYEGLYIYALNAANGQIVWKNDTIGERSHELPFGGISPSGYLLASEALIYVPSGRSLPVAFDRKTGAEQFLTSPIGKQGGTWALLDNDKLIAGVDSSGSPRKYNFDAKTGKYRGDAFGWFPGVDMVVTKDHAYVLTEHGINSIDRAHYSNSVSKANRFGKERKELDKKLKELRGQRDNASAEDKPALQEKVDKMKGEIAGLAAQEREVKAASDTWFFEKKGLRSLVMAGDVVIAGGQDQVIAASTDTGKQLWSHAIEGNGAGLGVSDGYLLVSSDSGNIYCFGKTAQSKPEVIQRDIVKSPYPDDKKAKLYKESAKTIADSLAVKKGYCLVLDCGEGRLAYELANLTDMQIIGLENDPGKLATARAKLASAGLLGKRVSIEPWDIDDLPIYFANLIVSDAMLTKGKTSATNAQIDRVLRPYGGISMLGKKKFFSNKIGWKKTVRSKLAGDGEWTHQYANPQNTACSGDELVSGRLGIQWFGEPGPSGMVERHAKAASPLAKDGRLFVQGEEVIFACDAYNGTSLWKRNIPGAFRVRVDVDSSNIAVGEDGLYVGAYDKCYVLDPATGEDLAVFELPASVDGSKRRWGYISLVGDTLYGSAATALKQEYAAKYKADYPDGNEQARWEHQRRGRKWRRVTDLPRWENYIPSKGAKTGRTMTSDMFFAMNAKTGKLLWKYDGKEMANISMTVADGNVFLTDASVGDEQRLAAFKAREGLIADKRYDVAAKFKVDDADRDVRKVICLDGKTGNEIWSKTVDLTGCCGDTLASAANNGVLLLFGSVGSHDMWRYQQGQIEYRRVVAMDTKDGRILWSKPLNYMTRPLILGDTVIVEPQACDLYTGQTKMRSHPVTGEDVAWQFLRPGHTCSMTAASANSLFYRSASTAMYNLEEDRGVTIFGGYRPGCWLTVIPANGLVLSAEASSGCTCSYPIRCSLAFVRKPDRAKPYTVFVTGGSSKPVKHLAINFGAPADMKDDEGKVWFGYPGPKNDGSGGSIHFLNYGVKFNLKEKVLPGMGYYSSDHRGKSFAGTDKPWLFTSGCRGMVRCELPLIDEAAGQSGVKYTVRLGFKAMAGDKGGGRVFDVKLGDEVVLRDFDVLKSAGETDRVVIKEFKGVSVKNNLSLQFVPKTTDCGIDQAPIISFIEVIREDWSIQAMGKDI